MRRIQRHHHQNPRNQPRNRQRQNPPTKDKQHLPPIHRPQIIIHQRNTHRRTRQALRRTNWQPQSRRQQHRNRRPKLHTKPSRRRQLRNLIPQRPNNMIPENPKSQTQKQARNNEHPNRRRRPRRHLASLIRRIGSGPGADGVGDVVGAVRDGHQHCGRDLRVGPEVLDAVVVVDGALVGFGEGFGVVRYAVAGYALHDDEFRPGPEALRVEHGEVGCWCEEALSGSPGDICVSKREFV